MAFEQNNSAFEFETMLRSHLSRGGSMVEACGGFDADTASAYLENALGQVARARYDTHLAGCPSCRRSVIDLSRLIQSSNAATLAEEEFAKPQVGLATPSRKGVSWKSVLADWLGVSEWNLAARNWGLATAGAAGAVLLALLATQLWRQPERGVAISGIPIATSADGIQRNASASPTPAETVAAEGGQMIGVQASGIPAPRQVGPASEEQNLALGISSKIGTGSATTSDAAFRLTGDGGMSVALPPGPTAPAPNVAPVLANNFASGAATNLMPLVESKQAVALPEAPPEVANARILVPINPSPNDNPMAQKKAPQPTSNVFNRALSFVPARKDAPERKPEIKEIEEGAPKLLAIRVRDKVFNFRGGMWVDQAYKPDMAWRITKLVQDSDEYKKVLADDPPLKDFFDHGTVIVVWKDKVYKVVAK